MREWREGGMGDAACCVAKGGDLEDEGGGVGRPIIAERMVGRWVLRSTGAAVVFVRFDDDAAAAPVVPVMASCSPVLFLLLPISSPPFIVFPLTFKLR